MFDKKPKAIMEWSPKIRDHFKNPIVEIYDYRETYSAADNRTVLFASGYDILYKFHFTLDFIAKQDVQTIGKLDFRTAGSRWTPDHLNRHSPLNLYVIIHDREAQARIKEGMLWAAASRLPTLEVSLQCEEDSESLTIKDISIESVLRLSDQQ